MSNYESITPSLKLCRLIPADEFDYSELWWLVETMPGNKHFHNEYVCERGTCKDGYGGDFAHYPAPTAQEILESLTCRGHLVDVASSWCSGYTVKCHDSEEAISETDVNLAEAAMRLWLKLNQ